MISKEQIRALAQERIDELNVGIFIVDINITPRNDIFVELDKMSCGISIDECVRVSRNIEHNLDREKEDFSLQVSSAGMDKPLRVEEQFIKNRGREVRAVLNHGSVEGILIGHTDDAIVIETETKERIEGKKKKVLVKKQETLQRSEIKEIKRVISFGNNKKP